MLGEEKESEWIQLVRERYEPPADVEMERDDEECLLLLLNAPEQYEVEEVMLQYANEHPDASMKELVDYFDEVAPEGLPPCASEWDDDEDE